MCVVLKFLLREKGEDLLITSFHDREMPFYVICPYFHRGNLSCRSCPTSHMSDISLDVFMYFWNIGFVRNVVLLIFTLTFRDLNYPTMS